ncbi:hypothetical protein [Planococcus sp. SSTMD024]
MKKQSNQLMMLANSLPEKSGGLTFPTDVWEMFHTPLQPRQMP